MKDFVAVDVETANREPSSICSIGCVKVRDERIVDSFYSLVHPEPDYYSYVCQRVHELSDEDTYNAPPFDEVWAKILDFAEGLPFVAHNAPFDHGCISAACDIYQLDSPATFNCTLRAARRSIPRMVCPSKALPSLCDFFGIPFNNHHNALADAEACAKLAVILL